MFVLTIAPQTAVETARQILSQQSHVLQLIRYPYVSPQEFSLARPLVCLPQCSTRLHGMLHRCLSAADEVSELAHTLLISLPLGPAEWAVLRPCLECVCHENGAER